MSLTIETCYRENYLNLSMNNYGSYGRITNRNREGGWATIGNMYSGFTKLFLGSLLAGL